MEPPDGLFVQLVIYISHISHGAYPQASGEFTDPSRGRAQYGIDLPGSLHTNKIPAILGRYPLLGFFCHLNIVPLDRDNGTSNSSNTDVVEKVNLLVAASQHGGTSVAEGSP